MKYVDIKMNEITKQEDALFEKISKLGDSISKKYLPINFRKQDGFLKTNNISKMLNIYRQNYCGCEFAKKDLI